MTTTIKMDEFQIEDAIERHSKLNMKKMVDTNVLNILTGLLMDHPELLEEVESHVVIPLCGHHHCEASQDKVLDLILEEDWGELYSLLDHAYLDL